MAKDLTVTVVSWNTRELLSQCLRSLETASTRPAVEVHVVDNASTDGSAEMVRQEFPDALLISNDRNLGFAAAANQSWRVAQGRYWLLLNPDSWMRPGSLDALLDFMEARPRAGLASARLVGPDGRLQHSAQAVPAIGRTLLEASRLHKLLPAATRGRLLLGPYWAHDRATRVGWTWGTALLARREAVEAAGALSEDFFLYGEDLEWCLRMREHGWEVWFCPDAEVVHRSSSSASQVLDERSRSQLVTDGLYRALARHRHPAALRALQAATIASLAVEWLVRKARGGQAEPVWWGLVAHAGALRRILTGGQRMPNAP